jgi:serine/threonine protein kinase
VIPYPPVTTGAPTTRLIGRYAIYQAIASGGMATVFLGRLMGPVGFARTVAIKRLHAHYASDPKFVTMFLDEARIAARVRHPNVVPTLDVVATNGELFLVMEYVHGESLGRLMRAAVEQGSAIPVPIVVAIMSGVLQGLHAAHEAKSERGVALQIIHRDVSPQNILLGRDGTARILDFGVARAEERLHTTQEGLVKGKLAYMAPEQVRGEAIGPPTDVYAAAVVMWEALTGRPLFRGTGEGGMVVEVLEAKIAPPSTTLRAAGDTARADEVLPLDELLMRAFARKKENRWQTARELARELEAAVSPATAAQVSDWVESAAGVTLRQRASLVAEIESSSAVDLTHGDVGVAMGKTAEPAARNDSPASSASTTTPERSAPTIPRVQAAPKAEDAPRARDVSPSPEAASSHADPAPPTTADPQPETVPLDTAKDASRPTPLATAADDNSPPPAVASPPLPGAEPASHPLRPLPGTLVSVPSPMAGTDVRGNPKFAETMQSKASPTRKKDPTPPPVVEEAPRAPPITRAITTRSRAPLTLLAAVVVGTGLGGAAYAYMHSRAQGSGDAAKPVDTTGVAGRTSRPRDALDPTEPSAKPAGR